jgi:SAM-dependent methyltransferase
MDNITLKLRCPSCHAPLSGMEEHDCGSCGFKIIVINKIPVLVRDRTAIESQIDKARSEGLSDWYESPQTDIWQGPYRHHMRKRREYLDRVLGSCGRFHAALDLGCGDGVNLAWLSGYAEHIYGSDYNLLRLARAAHSHPAAAVFMADVTDYPAQDASFDLIFFNHVLEHIPDDDRALAEARRILKPGGLLILGVPNEGAFFWQLAYALQPSVRRASDHINFYTARSISEKCTRAGLRIREVHPIGWGVPHWRLDSMVRGYKWVDDFLETVGRAVLPSQATSLYLIAERLK